MLTVIRPFKLDKEYGYNDEVPGSVLDPALKAKLINTRFIQEAEPPKGKTQLRVIWRTPFEYGDKTYRAGDILPDAEIAPRKRLALINSGYVEEEPLVVKPKAVKPRKKARKRTTKKRATRRKNTE
jgi:hypothetical protein